MTTTAYDDTQTLHPDDVAADDKQTESPKLRGAGKLVAWEIRFGPIQPASVELTPFASRAAEARGQGLEVHELVRRHAAPQASADVHNAALVHAAREVLDTELGEMACTGSDAPAEHALGQLKDALADDSAKGAPFLQEEDQYLLHRFIETTEDGEGYDLTKEEVKRLAELGVLSSQGFGRYGVTMFGYWAHEHFWEQKPSLPLKTNSDRDKHARAAIAKQGMEGV